MAMTMSGEYQIAAPREVVWVKTKRPGSFESLHPGLREPG